MLNEFIPYDRIVKIKPVIAQVIKGKRETMAQVKKRTGCTLIVNGGTYTPQYKPDSGLKIDGNETRRSEYYGLGSNDEKHLEFSYAGIWTKDYFGAYKDYIRDGVFVPRLKDNAKRGRTGVGYDARGIRVVSIADNDASNKCTSTAFMQTYFKDCTHAINLDGGGSSQWDGPAGYFESGRRVLWYLCLWTKPETVDFVVHNVRTYLTARNKASVFCKELGRLHTGDLVKVKEFVGSYAKIAHGSGVAYVTGKYLRRL
jgi:hypothetical protein